MNAYQLDWTEEKTFRAIIIANDPSEALKLAQQADFSITRELKDKHEIYIDKHSMEDLTEVSVEDFSSVINCSDKILIDPYSTSDKEKYPFLISMYDSSDPDHTRGSSDYFADQLAEMIIDNPENKAAIMKEMLIIIKFDEVEIR